MVHKVCCVPGCKNNSDNNPDLTYHHMPRRDQLRKEWLTSIGTPEFVMKPYTTLKGLQVCSKHFTATHYQFPGSKKLNTGAVPNIFEPLTLSLPAKLRARLRETTHNAEDTPAIDLPVALESPMSSHLAENQENISIIDLPVPCEIPQYEVVIGPDWDEISESSDHSITENVPATPAEVTNNIAELRQLLIFKDLDSDNATDCNESNTTEVDGEIFITIEEQQAQEDSPDTDDCAEDTAEQLTTEQLSKIIGMVKKVSDHIVEVDPNIARSVKVRRTINNAIRCYNEMYETKQVKKK